MGTDRDEIECVACPCGNGFIRVDHCSPDHPWGGSTWLEHHLDCQQCSKQYVIVAMEDFNGSKLVSKADANERKARQNKWHAQNRAIEASAEFKAVLAALDAAVAACRSAAAEYRLLTAAGVHVQSIGLYRRHRKYTLTAGEVVKTAEALGIRSPNLVKMHAIADQYWQDAQTVVPAVKTQSKYLKS